MLSAWLRRRKIAVLRLRLAAAKKLKRARDPTGHWRIINRLAVSPLWNVNKSRPRLRSVSDSDFEVCMRQKLVQRLMSSALGEFAAGTAFPDTSIVAAFPAIWRDICKEQGIRIRQPASWLEWARIVLGRYILGVRRGLTLVLYAASGPSRPVPETGGAIVLPGLQPGNVPSGGSSAAGQFNFACWVMNNYAPARGKVILAHVARSQTRQVDERLWVVGEAFEPILGAAASIRFAGDCLFRVALAAIKLLFGRWHDAYMLADILEFVYVRNAGIGKCTHYLFCSTEFQVRPLWSYFAENAGARIIFAFYSTNSLFISTEAETIIEMTPGYVSMSWPEYLLWDRYQADFIRSASLRAAEIDIAGPVDYTDGAGTVSVPATARTPIVAIFDVSAFQPILAAEKGILDPYYTVKTVNAFLTDVHAALTAAGATMIYKRKRPFIRLAATAYRRQVEALIRNQNVILVDPAVAARRVIQRASGVISIPYTSTALIGAAEGKPSVYYDPTGCLPEYSALGHGVRVIKTADDLIKWIAALSEPQRPENHRDQEPISD